MLRVHGLWWDDSNCPYAYQLRNWIVWRNLSKPSGTHFFFPDNSDPCTSIYWESSIHPFLFVCVRVILSITFYWLFLVSQSSQMTENDATIIYYVHNFLFLFRRLLLLLLGWGKTYLYIRIESVRDLGVQWFIFFPSERTSSTACTKRKSQTAHR